jgi:predicted Zn-ribbon and HTH transcriptional regulator
MKKSCYRCSYEWETRINNPKECPRCKSRLDRHGKIKKEVENAESES